MLTTKKSSVAGRYVVLVILLAVVPTTWIHAWESNSNLRWSLDASSRTQYITSGKNQLGFQNTLGIDTQQVLTGLDRNLVTFTIQAYMTRADELRRRPPYFDSETDWKLLPKVNTANIHVRGDGRLNFLVGHPELPYGLEPSISTNGTLRQLLTGRNLGLKTDWGIGVNGTLSRASYAMTLTRGTGIDYYHRQDPWALTGRVGSILDSEEFFGQPGFGVSWLAGEIRTPQRNIVERYRVGIDGQWYRGLFGLLTEVSVGQDDSDPIMNSFLELNAISRNATKAAYLQSRWLRKEPDDGWQDAWTWTIGVRLTPNPRWTWSFQFDHEAEVFGDRSRDNVLNFQIRRRN